MIETFGTWLLKQRDRDDPIGDLANDFAGITDGLPRDQMSVSAVTAEISARGGCEAAVRALHEADVFYRMSAG